MDLKFGQQLAITIIDKFVIGLFLAGATYLFTRSLDKFRGTQSLELARFTEQQHRLLEEFKVGLSSKTESERNIRAAVAELTKTLAALNHSIAWVSWIAKHEPDNLRTEDLRDYDRKSNIMLGEIVKARVALIALSKATHDEISSEIEKLIALDVKTGEAKIVYLNAKEDGIPRLVELHSESLAFDQALLDKVSGLNWRTLCG